MAWSIDDTKLVYSVGNGRFPKHLLAFDVQTAISEAPTLFASNNRRSADLSVSPDGSRLVIAHSTKNKGSSSRVEIDHSLQICCPEKCQPVGPPIKVSKDLRVSIITFSPCGAKLLAVCIPLESHLRKLRDSTQVTQPAQSSIMVLSAETGTLLYAISGHSADINHAVFSSDSKLIASCSGNQVSMWSSGGPEDARIQDNSVRVWNAETGVQLLCTQQGDTPINCVVFSPDCELLAAGDGIDKSHGGMFSTNEESGGGSVFVISLDESYSGAVKMKLTGHTRAVTDVCFSPGADVIASGSVDGITRLWDAMTGQTILVITCGRAIQRLTFTFNGDFLVTAGNDGSTCFWDVQTGEEKQKESVQFTFLVNSVPQKGLGPYAHTLCPLQRVGNNYIVSRSGSYSRLLLVCRSPSTSSLPEELNATRRFWCLGENRWKEDDVVAFFHAPSRITSLRCIGDKIVVGCSNGKVLFLRAPPLHANGQEATIEPEP